MFLGHSSAISGAKSTLDGRRESGRATHTLRVAVREDVATTLKTTASPTGSALLTANSDGQSGVTSAPAATTSASVSSSSSSTGHAARNGTIAVIIIAVVFVLALAIASKVYFNWRRRVARKHNSTNSTFIQYARYTDASPRRVSVVPRDDDDVLPPPIKPPEWDARSAAASSTAATFDSPISASDRDFGPGAQVHVQVQSLDEKLRDIFYPAQAVPNPVRASASFVPSFSSPVSATTTVTATPISPPPRAAHTQFPSFVPEPITSPQAWTNPPPSPLPLYPSQTPAAQSTFLSPWSTVGYYRSVSVSPSTPVYVVPEIRVNGRPPSYSRH